MHERVRAPRGQPSPPPAFEAAEIVARKLNQFSRDRRALAHAIAKHLKIEMSNELEQFFDAAEAGRWDELKQRFEALNLRRQSQDNPTELQSLWGPILETFGVAEAAHDWPAQKLLDYGQAILGALRPGMVYVGGTDPGRFIPTLLNETSEGERHILLTQNGLADATYLDYVAFQYHDQMTTLSQEDSKAAFQAYVADAQKRLAHDLQFPDEPKQIRPGEEVSYADDPGQPGASLTTDGIRVSGQVAVMGVNEILLQMILARNPDLTFGLEESFPLKSTYATAAPLGPIMELRVQDEQTSLSPENAQKTADYWRTAAEQLLAAPEASDEANPRRAYSKMATGQASLLADHNLFAEAEQTYRAAIDICPWNSEAVFQYINLLQSQKRPDDALLVAQSAVSADPKNQQFRNLLDHLKPAAKGPHP